MLYEHERNGSPKEIAPQDATLSSETGGSTRLD